MILKDERIAGDIRYVMTNNPGEVMQVPDEVRKCAIFVGRETKDGQKVCGGTAFFVAKPLVRDWYHATYCVTAQHNLERIKKEGGYKVWLRLNMVGGKASWLATSFDDWVVHPTDANTDVAVLRFPWEENLYDHKSWPLWLILDQERIRKEEIGIGDEVFFPGLFVRHAGGERNIPIVRIGNIAAMPEEKINSKNYCMDAYLVEARSIGGLSGSPVFVQPGLIRIIDHTPTPYRGQIYYLMGLMHGHWDSPHAALDSPSEDFREANEKVNMGIAIVVPVTKIMEVINQPSLQKLDDADAARWLEENKPALDDRFHSAITIVGTP